MNKQPLAWWQTPLTAVVLTAVLASLVVTVLGILLMRQGKSAPRQASDEAPIKLTELPFGQSLKATDINDSEIS
ncbi:MAG: hypothetical protein IT423_18530 [Pirellulaceae bacterium]|nr:hypothetical protein [Pirellulaceae bacterium]